MTVSHDESQRIERSSWRNWTLLAGTCVATTAGLATALFPILRSRFESPWPWMNTDIALVCGLSLVVAGFAAHLTFQQRKLSALRRRLEVLESERQAHLKQHYERLMGLLRVSRILGSETDPRAVFDAITSTCHDIFESQRVSLMTLDPDTRELVVRSVAGNVDADKMIGVRQRLGDGIAGWVAQQGRALVIGDEQLAQIRPNQRRPGDRMHEAMVVPIQVREELVGVLNVGSASDSVHYDDEDLKALQVFAENAGTCIRHAQQAQWMRQTIQQLSGQKAQRQPSA